MFVVILAQSAATSRAYAGKYEEAFSQDIDLVGLGAANVAAALSGTFVVNGSPTQTQVAESAGGRSQLAQLTTSAVVLIVLRHQPLLRQRLPPHRRRHRPRCAGKPAAVDGPRRRAIGDVDYTADAVLTLVIEHFRQRHIRFAHSSIHGPVREQLDRYGISAALGPGTCYDTPGEAPEAFHAAEGVTRE